MKLYIFEEPNMWWGQWILGEFRDLEVKVTVVLPVFSILAPPGSLRNSAFGGRNIFVCVNCSQNLQSRYYLFYWGLYKIVYAGE